MKPEPETWTYGLPARIQAHLSTLEEGDLLAFYGGLRPIEPSDDAIPPAALYLFGYFDVLGAVRARDYTRDDLLPMFGENFHVRHPELFDAQHDRLVLVKGNPSSRLLSKAQPISGIGRDRRGQPIHVLSEEMQGVFGTFAGVGSIQRCVPRWVAPEFVERAAAFVRSLP